MNFDKDFVVHNYSATSTQPSQTLLYTAYELIRDSFSESPNWVNVTVVDVPPPIKFGPTTKLVQYPPFFEKLHQKRLDEQVHTIDVDWGAPIVEQNDIFSPEDLEEFRVTNLNFIFNIKHEEMPLKHLTPLSQQLLPIEKGPLHGILPQPHFHPSSPPNLIGSLKLIPYKKTKPILIPPLTESSSPSPHSRSAWLVPIRGKLPWERCTAALLLNSSYDGLRFDQNREKIVWTPTSIRSFWDFLLEIKAKGSAGAIGLSFHASRNDPLIFHSNNSVSVSSVMPVNQQSMSSNDIASHVELTTLPPRALLSTVDYIKIYHEGLNAMHLRNMLHLWSYTESQSLEKIRILKGATLALVDERSAGILLS